MSTPDTNNIGIKLQSAGENLNTWGDPNLNNDLIVLSNIGSKWNPLTINGNTTISETNYATTNDTEVATIDLVAGTVAAAFNVVFPARDKRILVRNSTGFAATLKLSATSGFALPTGRIALIATDGTTDLLNMTPNYGGVAVPTAASLDIPAWSAVETAIATASIPASAGTALFSGTDTTAGYIGQKITAGTGIDIDVQNPGANENGQISVDTTEIEEFLALSGKITATLSSGTTAMTAKRRYRISSTATGTLPTMAAGDFVIVEFTVGAGIVGTVGRNSQTIDGSATDDTYTGDGTQGPVIRYDYASGGVVTSRLIEGIPA